MQPSGAVQSAIRESDQALCRQIAEWEPLEFGVAHYAPQFATLPAANQLRDVWLANVNGEEAYRRTEDYYRARGLTCWLWTPAAAQPVEPLAALLSPMGWRRADLTVMGLAHWGAAAPAPNPAVRILPARAMHRRRTRPV